MSGWMDASIGSTTLPVESWNPAKAGGESKFTYVDLSSVSQETKEIVTRAVLSASEAPSRARQIIRHRDILISTVRPNLNAVAWVPLDFDGATASTGFCVLRPDPYRLCDRYLFHWVRTTVFVDAMVKLSSGASYPAVSERIIKGSEFPLPSLDEQKRIAAVLDKADTLARQRQESLKLARKLLQSVFIDMFGDPASNPKGWDTCQLEQLCDKIVDCPHSTPIYETIPTGLFCVRSSDIQDGKLDLASTRHVSKAVFEERIARHEPQAGEVVYTREGGRLGFAAQIPRGKQICLGQRMMLFRANRNVSTNAFLASLLNSESFRRIVLNLVGGGAAPRVNIKDLRTITVYRPRIELQERFEKCAAALAEEEESLTQSEVQAERLFRSLQHRAFRGELDLGRLKLDADYALRLSPPVPEPESAINAGGTKHPSFFIAPPEIEAQLLALEAKIDAGPDDSIPWSEDYFKYRTLSQLLTPPYSFSEIWEKVDYDMPGSRYEDVKEKVFEYVEQGLLEQKFDEARKEIVFHPRA